MSIQVPPWGFLRKVFKRLELRVDFDGKVLIPEALSVKSLESWGWHSLGEGRLIRSGCRKILFIFSGLQQFGGPGLKSQFSPRTYGGAEASSRRGRLLGSPIEDQHRISMGRGFLARYLTLPLTRRGWGTQGWDGAPGVVAGVGAFLARYHARYPTLPLTRRGWGTQGWDAAPGVVAGGRGFLARLNARYPALSHCERMGQPGSWRSGQEAGSSPRARNDRKKGKSRSKRRSPTGMTTRKPTATAKTAATIKQRHSRATTRDTPPCRFAPRMGHPDS